MGLKTAAKLHNASRSVLQRHADDIRLNPKQAVAIVPGHKTVLHRETENSLFAARHRC